jgi:hypothetical protein
LLLTSLLVLLTLLWLPLPLELLAQRHLLLWKKVADLG